MSYRENDDTLESTEITDCMEEYGKCVHRLIHAKKKCGAW